MTNEELHWALNSMILAGEYNLLMLASEGGMNDDGEFVLPAETNLIVHRTAGGLDALKHVRALLES